jgi:hypothetical protein
MLAADGCASSSGNPACCSCAVWAPAGRGEWRSPYSAKLVWACSSAENEGVACPYVYALTCMPLTVATIVNSAL